MFVYLRDAESGETSPYLRTTVYRLSESNTAPEPVELGFPEDGATVNTGTHFHWSTAADADGDPVTYRLEVALQPEFVDLLVYAEGLTEPLAELEGLPDGETAWWRVVVTDQYGATSSPNAVREVHFDNHNTQDYGAIAGRVTDSLSDAPVSGATVSMNRLGGPTRTVQTDRLGYYAFANVVDGSYSLTVSVPTHVDKTTQGLMVYGGNRVTVQLNDGQVPVNATDGAFRVSEATDGEGEGEGEGEAFGCVGVKWVREGLADYFGDILVLLLALSALAQMRRIL